MIKIINIHCITSNAGETKLLKIFPIEFPAASSIFAPPSPIPSIASLTPAPPPLNIVDIDDPMSLMSPPR